MTQFEKIAENTFYNQQKVLSAFINHNVSEAHFTPSTGYGYGDRGREVIDLVAADAFGAEAAIVRHNFVSGTHALTVALSANLLPGDELLSPVGLPYDTLQEVIGIRESPCSLKEYGVSYRQVDLLLFDDIHFIAGKDQTQEEFFNTFNTLIQNNKQIVVTLDRPPREVKTLDDRIRSRLESGLFADISSPDFVSAEISVTPAASPNTRKRVRKNSPTFGKRSILNFFTSPINPNFGDSPFIKGA